MKYFYEYEIRLQQFKVRRFCRKRPRGQNFGRRNSATGGRKRLRFHNKKKGKTYSQPSFCCSCGRFKYVICIQEFHLICFVFRLEEKKKRKDEEERPEDIAPGAAQVS